MPAPPASQPPAHPPAAVGCDAEAIARAARSRCREGAAGGRRLAADAALAASRRSAHGRRSEDSMLGGSAPLCEARELSVRLQVTGVLRGQGERPCRSPLPAAGRRCNSDNRKAQPATQGSCRSNDGGRATTMSSSVAVPCENQTWGPAGIIRRLRVGARWVSVGFGMQPVLDLCSTWGRWGGAVHGHGQG